MSQNPAMMPKSAYTVGNSVGQVEPPGNRVCSVCGHRDSWLVVTPFQVTCLNCGKVAPRQ